MGNHAAKLLQSLGKVITKVWLLWQDRNIFTVTFCTENKLQEADMKKEGLITLFLFRSLK